MHSLRVSYIGSRSAVRISLPSLSKANPKVILSNLGNNNILSSRSFLSP
ncbi:MAG: hypothetical protein ACKPKO_23565 [Candidatus Fonsibacter sp.]